MTEYTTDPEAIAKYLAALSRTANWIDSLSGKDVMKPEDWASNLSSPRPSSPQPNTHLQYKDTNYQTPTYHPQPPKLYATRNQPVPNTYNDPACSPSYPEDSLNPQWWGPWGQRHGNRSPYMGTVPSPKPQYGGHAVPQTDIPSHRRGSHRHSQATRSSSVERDRDRVRDEHRRSGRDTNDDPRHWRHDGKRDGRMDDGHSQGGQWGDQSSVETDSEAWDTGQRPHSPRQSRGPTTTSPLTALQPPGPSALANLGRNPQSAPGAPRPPHTAPQPSPTAQPPMTLSPRSQQDSGAAAAASGWRNWGAEAIAVAKNKPFVPLLPLLQGGEYGQQGRVAFAGQDPFAPFEDHRADATLEAHMIYDSIMSSHVGATREPRQRPGRGSDQNSTRTGQYSKGSKKEMRAQWQSAPNGRGQQQVNSAWAQENSGWQENTTRPCPNPGPGPSLSARSLVYVTCSLCLVFLSWGLSIV